MSRLASILVCIVAVAGKVSKGSSFANDFGQWEYIDRFCFTKDTGRINIKAAASTTPDREGTKLYLYHDVEGSGFDSVYKSGRSCEWKTSQATSVIPVGPGSQAASPKGKSLFPQNVIPRWWYIVAANCGKNQLGLVGYEIEWTNGEEHDGKFEYQFGVNEYGIFESLIFTCVALLVLIILTMYTSPQVCVGMCQMRPVANKVHHIMKGFLWIESIVFIAVVLQLIDKDIYSGDGIGIPELRHLGLILELLPDVLMVSLFLFLAKGYLTHHQKIPTADLRMVGEIAVVYIACEIALLVWEFSDDEIDPIYHFYRYQGQAGVMLCVLRVFLGVFFLKSCFVSYKNSVGSVKHQLFFSRFAVVGGLFFLVLPVSVMIAHYSQNYNMNKVVVITEMLMNLGFYWGFFFFFIFHSDALAKDGAEVDMNRNLRGSEIGMGQFDDRDIETDGVDIDDIDVDALGDDDEEENKFMSAN